MVDVSAGRWSFCAGALSQRLSVHPLANLHKRPCKRTGAQRNVHHTPSSLGPCPRLLLLRRALRRGLGSSSAVSGSSGEAGIPRARHAAGRCTFAAAAPSRPLHLRECSAPSRISAPSRMLIVPPLAAVLSLGARQDAMRVMQGPWTPRCYCTVADLLRFIASHFITRVASRCVNTNRSRRFIMSPVPPCGKQSPVVLELASFQWLVNLLEAASTLGTAATLHWLGDGRVGGSVGWVGGRDPPIHPPPNRLSG